MSQCRGAARSGARCRRESQAGRRCCAYHHKDQSVEDHKKAGTYHPPEPATIASPVVKLRSEEPSEPLAQLVALMEGTDPKDWPTTRGYGYVGPQGLKVKKWMIYVVQVFVERLGAK